VVKPGAFLLVNTIEFFIRVLPEQESGKVLKKRTSREIGRTLIKNH